MLFLVSNLFPPNIDKDLFSRYLEVLTLEEKYFLKFSYPSVFASIVLKPLRVIFKLRIGFSNTEIFMHSDVVVAPILHNYVVNEQSQSSKNLFKFPIFRVRYLDLYRSSLSAAEVLQFLSFKTKNLKIHSMKSQEKEATLTFQEILKAALNLEEINLLDANIKINNTWSYDLLRLNQGEKLNLSLSISEVNFDIAKLATFMKTKSVTLHLDITLLGDDPENGAFNEFKRSLEKYFISSTECEKDQSICITYDNKPTDVFHRKKEYFIFKDL